jgi:hypothetical protein
MIKLLQSEWEKAYTIIFINCAVCELFKMAARHLWIFLFPFLYGSAASDQTKYG